MLLKPLAITLQTVRESDVFISKARTEFRDGDVDIFNEKNKLCMIYTEILNIDLFCFFFTNCRLEWLQTSQLCALVGERHC